MLRVQLAVLCFADGVEQFQLGFEEIDVPFFVGQQFLEQAHGDIVAGLLADLKSRGLLDDQRFCLREKEQIYASMLEVKSV